MMRRRQGKKRQRVTATILDESRLGQIQHREETIVASSLEPMRQAANLCRVVHQAVARQ